MKPWNAAEARNGFSDLVEAAVSEGPQIVRRQDGREVVVVSCESGEAMKPGLRDVLLRSPGRFSAEEAAAFDADMMHARRTGTLGIAPRPAGSGDAGG